MHDLRINVHVNIFMIIAPEVIALPISFSFPPQWQSACVREDRLQWVHRLRRCQDISDKHHSRYSISTIKIMFPVPMINLEGLVFEDCHTRNSYLCAYTSCKCPIKSRIAFALLLYTWRWDMSYQTDDLKIEGEKRNWWNWQKCTETIGFFLMIQWSICCDTVFFSSSNSLYRIKSNDNYCTACMSWFYYTNIHVQNLD